jgi:hypothetical protein
LTQSLTNERLGLRGAILNQQKSRLALRARMLTILDQFAKPRQIGSGTCGLSSAVIDLA